MSDKAEISPNFGELLKAGRTAKKLSVQELATQAGVEAATIKAIEDESQHPHQTTINKLAEVIPDLKPFQKSSNNRHAPEIPANPVTCDEWLLNMAAELSAKPTILSIMEHIFPAAQKRGISAMRYYSYEESERRLVSVECVGMSNDAAIQAVRRGQIIRLQATSPIPDFDSFMCLEIRQPTIVQSGAGQHARANPERFFNMKVREDGCAQMAGIPRFSDWHVDFPLFAGKRPAGKLSCDLATQNEQSLEEFRLIVNAAGPYLVALSQRETRAWEAPAGDWRRAIHSTTSLEALYQYCTKLVPTTEFECRNASIFEFYKDEQREEQLILRYTSFPPFESHYDQAVYGREKGGLTMWVAQTRRTLRLHSLTNQSCFAAQCKAYDSELRWGKREDSFDSNTHSSFLAVPLVDPTRTESNLLGVLRLTESFSEDLHFSERDQRRLEFVAREISTRIVALRDLEFAALKIEVSQQIATLRRAKREGIPKAIIDVLKRAVPESRSAKLFLFNEIQSDGKTVKHAGLGGSLSEGLKSTVLPLANTFTNYAKDHDGCVSLCNLAAAARSGIFQFLRMECVYALACRVMGRRGGRLQPIGVIVLESEKYDVTFQREGRLLEYLAEVAEEVLSKSP